MLILHKLFANVVIKSEYHQYFTPHNFIPLFVLKYFDFRSQVGLNEQYMYNPHEHVLDFHSNAVYFFGYANWVLKLGIIYLG